jgi:hypothetical protein
VGYSPTNGTVITACFLRTQKNKEGGTPANSAFWLGKVWLWEDCKFPAHIIQGSTYKLSTVLHLSKSGCLTQLAGQQTRR